MSIELSIIMPCLNEEETLAICISKAKNFLNEHQVSGEIIIADNGSTDKSIEIANSNNTKVVHVSEKGYGSALRGGIEATKGTSIIMADADDSYDFYNLMPLLEELRKGKDLVMGNRFKGGIKKGAMPFLHYYLGNPVLSFIGRLFFKSPVRDFHCGLRGFSKESYEKLNLVTTGMEFASEMIVKACLLKMNIHEVPIVLSPDGRSRKPHLRTWHDGWRHLRFLMLYSPSWIFMIPGVALFSLGLILSVMLIASSVTVLNIVFDVNTLLYTSLFLLIGFQFILFYGLAKIYAVSNQLLPKSKRFDKLLKMITLERGLLFGTFFLLLGLILSLKGLSNWSSENYGELNREILRITIPAVTTLIMGTQIILFSFFFSILGLKRN